jgi:hypothetical protein
MSKYYKTVTPKNYPKNKGCYELVWEDIFMPFDVIKGLDTCPPDDEDSGDYKKTYWWVCPAEKPHYSGVDAIEAFIDLPKAKSFKTLEDAVEFCMQWRKEWLLKELKK